ncbi:MAG: metallophosphoesterase [Candidatus Diapherotrites archaeon]|nr:metallophosphoesterase [Candidatus Diapherotrites archaeon]
MQESNTIQLEDKASNDTVQKSNSSSQGNDNSLNNNNYSSQNNNSPQNNNSSQSNSNSQIINSLENTFLTPKDEENAFILNKKIENEVLSFAENIGLMLSKSAVYLLVKNDCWKEILKELFNEGVFFVDPNVLEKKLSRTKLAQVTQEVEVRKASFIAQAKDRAATFRVMEEYDVTGKSNSEGKVDDFLRLFRSKFELLSSMLKTRHNLSPKPIKSLAGIADREKVDVIGIVNKKWITKKGHTAFEIEDLEAKCIALVMEKEKDVQAKAERILEDNVVGIKGTKWGKDFIIIKEVYWPDVPIRPAKTINDDVFIGGITDMHVGSKLFFEDQFNRLLDYINGKNLSPKQQERVGKIQYLMVTGDNVAGVGVYPGQFDELLIKDIYEQYAKFEDLMLQIPDYIHTFICPGQHDAVRRAEPQPAIDKEFVPRLSKLRNFHFISSPSWVDVEGVKNLIYHGPSVNDLISSVNFLTMSAPQEGMLELLKKRDLMPKYGGKNPYVPEGRDYMVIKEEPDIIWFGDVHHKGYLSYRGTSILNSGCWEGQTDFQKKMGHTPTPCIFPTISLKDRAISETHFSKETVEEGKTSV